MGSSEVKDNLKDSLFFFADFSDLIVEYDEVVFESVDCFEVNRHAIPSYLFEFLGDYLIFEYFDTTFFPYLKAFPK